LDREHPWFQNIPTFDDYAVAEQILLMEADDKILQQKAPVSNIGRLNVGSNLPFLAKGERQNCYGNTILSYILVD
jgi:hypothetical protein